ncbi:MAG: PA-phosphatase, partial [Bdellovibrio sp. CG_4_9_14_3_um_filter_39_7]
MKFNGSALDITAMGSPTLCLLISAITVALLWINQRKRELVYFITVSLGAGIWSVIIKNIIERARPQGIPVLIHVEGFSYPSGHTLAATSIYLSLAFILNKNFKFKYSCPFFFSLSVILFSLVGFSRIYLGVHYPSDALSGVFFGSAWAI